MELIFDKNMEKYILQPRHTNGLLSQETEDLYNAVAKAHNWDWDKIMNPKIEGTLYYKGFRGQYWRGDEEDGEQDYFCGEMTNVEHAIFVLEGDSEEAIKLDFQEFVDEFLADFDENGKHLPTINPASGEIHTQTIEYYIKDPDILDHFYNHQHKPALKDVNFGIQDFINLHQTVYATPELVHAA
jgi:hypothetical protein